MPRPKDKISLINQNQNKFSQLITFIDQLPEDQINQTFEKSLLNRNIRDVLAHLYHWHTMMLKWYEEGMNDKTPLMPAPGYTWRTVPQLNLEINKLYQNQSYEEMRDRFFKSHQQVSFIIERHSEKELFTKKKYKWTGSTSLAAYLISSTCSHYEWALKTIKKGLKPALSQK